MGFRRYSLNEVKLSIINYLGSGLYKIVDSFSFRKWLEDSRRETITPTVIYDFYYITTVFQQGLNLDKYERHFIESHIKYTKKIYLDALVPVVYQQILKYVNIRRTDRSDDAPTFDVSALSDSPDERNVSKLHSAMLQTYRSDMNRRNDNWTYLTEHLAELSGISQIEAIIFHLDRINNAIHNTGQSIMSKLPNGEELMRALNDKFQSPTPKTFARFVSRDVREMFPPHSSFPYFNQ